MVCVQRRFKEIHTIKMKILKALKTIFTYLLIIIKTRPHRVEYEIKKYKESK